MNTITNYDDFIKYLKSLSDSKYREFHLKLTNGNTLIGVRTPKLKEIALYLSKNKYEEIFNKSKFKTYEEKVIYGLIIGYLKIDFNSKLKLLDKFLPLNDNWAINDIVCANLKSFKSNQEEGYHFIEKCLKSSNPWDIRFGLVLLLDFYINDNYIDKILKITNNIKSNEYYVKMANAWIISICYIKYPTKTKEFLNNNKLDDWTHNKAIQKIIESKRISKLDKIQLKKLKR